MFVTFNKSQLFRGRTSPDYGFNIFSLSDAEEHHGCGGNLIICLDNGASEA